MKINEEYLKEVFDDNNNLISLEPVYDKNFNFAYDVMDRLANEYENDIALVYKSLKGNVRKFTYGEMKNLSDKAANVFLNNGIKRNDSVMLILKRNYNFWISMLALHKIGAVAIPTSHMVSDDDIKERIEKTDVKAIVLLDDVHILKNVEKAAEDKNVIKFLVGKEKEGFLNFENLTDRADNELKRISTNVTDNMLYYFTSGTSGKPKAVIHDFSYPIAHIFTAKYWHGVKENGLHLTVADSGWAKSAWGKMYGQWFMHTAVMVYDYEQFYAGDMLKVLEEEKVTSFCAPPTIYKYIVREDIEKYDLSNLEMVTTAGESLPVEVAKAFYEKTGLTIREGFGQTETTLLICTKKDEKQVEGVIGKASPLYDMEIVDEKNNPCAAYEEGEMVIKLKNNEVPLGVFKGYLGEEDMYKKAFEGGVYHTKDKGYKDKDGNFVFIGRNDDVIKSSGYRIGPSEVEDILMKHPAVFECAVTGYPSKNRGYLVKASIILNNGFENDAHLKRKLQDFVKERSAIYKYPRIIDFVSDLPRTSNGKISRAKIREMDRKKLTIN